MKYHHQITIIYFSWCTKGDFKFEWTKKRQTIIIILKSCKSLWEAFVFLVFFQTTYQFQFFFFSFRKKANYRLNKLKILASLGFFQNYIVGGLATIYKSNEPNLVRGQITK